MLTSPEGSTRPFLSCFERHYESEALCIVFIMKINFHSCANNTEFQMKSFTLSLAFVMRFKHFGTGLLEEKTRPERVAEIETKLN